MSTPPLRRQGPKLLALSKRAQTWAPASAGATLFCAAVFLLQVVSVNARYNSRARIATGPAAISCASKRVHGVTFP
ncbi:hypothetical protein FBX97_0654 [Herbaspirillum sp. SJZ107]|nr:hypothetical protein FBX97_0654 [Herbaspirillum sp. SJZ107]